MATLLVPEEAPARSLDSPKGAMHCLRKDPVRACSVGGLVALLGLGVAAAAVVAIHAHMSASTQPETPHGQVLEKPSHSVADEHARAEAEEQKRREEQERRRGEMLRKRREQLKGEAEREKRREERQRKEAEEAKGDKEKDGKKAKEEKEEKTEKEKEEKEKKEKKEKEDKHKEEKEKDEKKDKKEKEEKEKKEDEKRHEDECDEPGAVCPHGCHTATKGEKCHKEVHWGMRDGIHAHPEWYPGLGPTSSFKEFQASLNASGHGGCSLPCGWPRSSEGEPCLCIFDIDRTLTGHQGSAHRCKGTEKVDGVLDAAYGGGTLVFSKLALNLEDTFCNRCYHGIVTAGTATGHLSPERARVLRLLGGIGATLSNTWSHRDNVQSSLVVGAIDGRKQESVRDIVSWFKSHRGIEIKDKRVHFFDDRDNNVPPFKGTGFNARQVSCASRGPAPAESVIGFCGGVPEEVVEDAGVHSCDGDLS